METDQKKEANAFADARPTTIASVNLSLILTINQSTHTCIVHNGNV